MTDSYDEIAYPGFPFPETHPDRLSVIGRLLGMDPAPAPRCRVLELGCGDGANLIPLALALPQSDFVGIDLAAQPIARGQSLARELGLRNIRLDRMDVRDVGPDFGAFDYVLACGLYSWAPEDARRQVLAIAGAHLRPHGIAYVSYYVYPGAHPRRMLREMMLAHARTAETPDERIRMAREFLDSLADSAPAGEYGALLKAEARRLHDRPTAALYHDELGEFYHPLYFREFIAEAAAHGLQFLAEATLSDTATGDIEREQHLDYLKGRSFRQTLLCRSDLEIDRCLRTAEIARLYAACSATATAAGAGTEFRTPRSGLRTAHPAAIAVLNALIEAWPRAVAVPELPGNPPEVEAILMSAFTAGMVKLFAAPPALAASPGERPVASPLARIQARAGDAVTTLLHTSVELRDPIGRRLLALLDGTRDRAALIAELLPLTGSSRETLAPALDENLLALARLGLLQ
ncbi:MAG: class I SAM-dependent methyltransferase [Bryobacteraceae bacterium]|jgi:SAM-dependent methyltransferase